MRFSFEGKFVEVILFVVTLCYDGHNFHVNFFLTLSSSYTHAPQ